MVGQVRDGNNECRSCPWIEKCSGGCRAAAIAVSSNYFAPEPAQCHFFKAGWYDRFLEVDKKALDGFLAAHPELSAEKAGGTNKTDDTASAPCA